MTNSVGITGPVPTAPQQTPAPAGAPVPAKADFQQQVTPNINSKDPNATISPRIVVDPLAGPITQFLNDSGQIESQIPSAAVVAYLRAGLTSEGYAKPTPEGQHQHSDSLTEKKSITA